MNEYFSNLKKLYGTEKEKNVSQSKCCKADVDIIETENRSYYVCLKCHHWCDLNLSDSVKKEEQE